MNVDSAMLVAHQAVRRGCIGDGCRDADCVSCATVVMAAEIRRLRAVNTQLERLVDSQPSAMVKMPAPNCRCGNTLIDGICGVCNS